MDYRPVIEVVAFVWIKVHLKSLRNYIISQTPLNNNNEAGKSSFSPSALNFLMTVVEMKGFQTV